MPDYKLLVVEDELDLLKLVVTYLKRSGFTVDGFTDPIRALEHFKENSSQYSLVITDIRMPRLTGLELAHEMQEIKPNLKIILTTAFDMRPRDLETMLPLLDYDELLLKPFELVKVRDLVKRTLSTNNSKKK